MNSILRFNTKFIVSLFTTAFFFTATAYAQDETVRRPTLRTSVKKAISDLEKKITSLEKEGKAGNALLIEPMMRLGQLYNSAARFDQAATAHSRALKIAKSVHGAEHISVAMTSSLLATVFEQQAKYDEAEAMYKNAIAMFKKILGKEHISVVSSLNNLAERSANRPEPTIQSRIPICNRYTV